MIYSQTQVLLSTVLIKGVSPDMRDALHTISSEMMPDALCADIYSAVIALDNFNATVNLDAVCGQMGNIPYFELAEFSNNVITTREPWREAAQIRNAYNDKISVEKLSDIVNKIQSGRVFDRNEISTTLQDMAVSLAPTSEAEPVFFSEYEDKYLNILEEREANPNGSFLDIGLELEINKTDLIILGGQPGMGKTSLALYINKYVAKQGKTALLFSLEMDGHQLFEREVSCEAKISTKKLKRVGQEGLQDYEWGNIGAALKELSTLPIAIDDNAKLSLPILIKKCKTFKNKHSNLALITVDYLTLMELPGAGNQNLSVAEATRLLKVLAKSIKTPILMLSQLNRESAKMKREPQNSDLRDSGAIEQDADKIIFPYRDEVHDENSPNKGLAKILKTKVRDDAPGSVLLRFEFGSFKPLLDGDGWSEQEEEKPVERKKF